MDYIHWKILYIDICKYKLRMKESVARTALKSDLNTTVRSIPLIVFPEGVTRKKEIRFQFKNKMKFKWSGIFDL